MSWLMGLVLTVAGAALPPMSGNKAVDLSVAEILSMPGKNRLEIAKLRKSQLVAPLEKLVFSSEVEFQDRWNALVLVVQLQGEDAKPLLVKAAKASEWFLRNAALVAASEVVPKVAERLALDLLSDPALVVRSAAVEVLEKSTQPQVRDLLWSELERPANFRKKQSLWIRPQIFRLLAKDPQRREIPLFVAGLQDPDPKIHALAIAGLQKLTGQRLGKPADPLQVQRRAWLDYSKKTLRL